MSPAKVALITGAGKKRVGFFIAEHLARRGFGLAIHYRTSAADAADTIAHLQHQFGVPAKRFQADLRYEVQVRAMIESVLGAFGRIDVLVNSAAIWEKKPLEEIKAEDVRLHFETNALSTFLCCQHAGLAMTQQTEGGCIINLGDWAEARPYVDYAAYFPSKGAVSAMTRSFAVELAMRNPKVRVNCILPGPVMLPADLSPSEREEAIRGTLVKHEGSPNNVAQAVMALIDNEFVTGVCLPVDGGRTIAGA